MEEIDAVLQCKHIRELLAEMMTWQVRLSYAFVGGDECEIALRSPLTCVRCNDYHSIAEEFRGHRLREPKRIRAPHAGISRLTFLPPHCSQWGQCFCRGTGSSTSVGFEGQKILHRVISSLHHAS